MITYFVAAIFKSPESPQIENFTWILDEARGDNDLPCTYNGILKQVQDDGLCVGVRLAFPFCPGLKDCFVIKSTSPGIGVTPETIPD
jgi:hypothetical protein